MTEQMLKGNRDEGAKIPVRLHPRLENPVNINLLGIENLLLGIKNLFGYVPKREEVPKALERINIETSRGLIQRFTDFEDYNPIKARLLGIEDLFGYVPVNGDQERLIGKDYRSLKMETEEVAC